MTIRTLMKGLFLYLPWLLLLLLLPIYPVQSLAAAVRGVAIWWEVLFPALFPFLVIAELLLGFGIVHFIGCLLDPLMRPIFRVPGYGGFVMAMGFASGYPIGARLTSQLWEARLINRYEGERLVAFTSTSDPIFLIGAVSVGFFHNAGLALVLAIAHYGGGIVVGICMRYHGKSTPRPRQLLPTHSENILKRALSAMHEARLTDSRPFGLLLKEAINTGIKLVFMIGGLVVFVSVLLELMTVTGVLNVLYKFAAAALQSISFPASLSPALVDGLFEVTLGAKAAGAASESIPLLHKTAMAAFVLSWSGLSVHAQIASLLTHTNIRYAPFLFARLLHGFISAILVYTLWRPLTSFRTMASGAIPVIFPGDPWPNIAYTFSMVAALFFGWLLMMLFLALLLSILKRMRFGPQSGRSHYRH